MKVQKLHESDNLIALKKITPRLEEALRFMNVIDAGSHEHGWREIAVEQGKAYIKTVMWTPEISLTDNYAAAKTIFPKHQHPGHEIFVVYSGEMHLYVAGKQTRVNNNGKPYYFDARYEHWARFSTETKYIAITIPADRDWRPDER